MHDTFRPYIRGRMVYTVTSDYLWMLSNMEIYCFAVCSCEFSAVSSLCQWTDIKSNFLSCKTRSEGESQPRTLEMINHNHATHRSVECPVCPNGTYRSSDHLWTSCHKCEAVAILELSRSFWPYRMIRPYLKFHDDVQSRMVQVIASTTKVTNKHSHKVQTDRHYWKQHPHLYRLCWW